MLKIESRTPFSALIIEKDFKAKTTLYGGSAADIMIEFIFWIFRVWISKLRVRCSKFRGHISEFGSHITHVTTLKPQRHV